MRAMASGALSYSSPSHSKPTNPTIAFLFTLRRDRHPLGRAWNTFFRACPNGTARVHVHVDPTFKPRTSAGNRTVGGQGAFANAVIPPPYLHIARFGYSMVQARMILMRHAAAIDPPADWFLFFSESDAPIRSCPDVLRYLARRSGSSFAYSDPAKAEQKAGGKAWERTFSAACTKCAAVNISAADYRHGPGWVGLHREHALPILHREREHQPAFEEGYDWRLLGVPDEWYWTTLVQAQDRRNNHILTYMEPGSAETGHSKMFYAEDLPRLVAKARGMPPSFFARKFPTTPQMDEALMQSLMSTRFASARNASSTAKRDSKTVPTRESITGIPHSA